MAEGKKRRREGGDITNTVSPSGLEQYVEVVFYECAFSAQYTANIQILFNIEDIQRRMPVGSFLEGFGEAKRKGLTWVNETIQTWLKKQTSDVQSFFKHDFRHATHVIQQRGQISVRVADNTYTLAVPTQVAGQIETAIQLLRYPMTVMEQIQRQKSSELLCLEKDAMLIIDLADKFGANAKELEGYYRLLM